MVGLGSPGLKEGKSNTGAADQDEEYQPPSLLEMPGEASGGFSKADAPEGQASMFAFMSVKQAEGPARFHLPGEPDILPSHPSQLQSNE